MPLKITNALPAFEEYDRSRGLAAGTVKRHMTMARRFARVTQELKGSNATMGQVDHRCVARFFDTLGGEQGHRNNALESLKAFLTWATKFGYLRPPFTAASLLEGYKSRPPERQPKYYLDAAEFPAALEAAGKHNPVDRAVVAIALYTLARQAEIASLTLGDLDLETRTIRLRRHKVKHWTKTGITPELANELSKWLAIYASHMGYFSPHTMIREHPDWLLIPSRQSWRGGYRLKPVQPVVMMERVAKRVLTGLGVQGTREGKSVEHKGEGIHTFRRSGARAMLKNLSEHWGNDRALVMVSAMLDHKDTKMTLQYIDMDRERDELNDWLRGNSMYEEPPEPPGASVTPLRRYA